MSTAKNLGLRLVAALFTLCIYGLAVTTAVNHVFSKPEPLKAALQESGIYEAAAENIVTEIAKESAKQTGVKLTSPVAKAATEKAVTPVVVQENIEKVIDGTYSWLDGTTATPSFKVSTGSIQNQVATNVSSAGVQRVKKLPTCTYAQMQAIDPNSIDPFSLKCQPPGLDYAALQSQFKSEIASGNLSEELSDNTLTANDLKSEDGQNVFAQAEQVPKVFQFGQITPWIFGIGALLGAPIIIFLAEGKRKGVKSLSFTLVLAAVLLVCSVIATTMIARAVEAPTGESAAMQAAILATIKSLASSLNRVFLIFAAIYGVLGIAGLMATRFVTAHKAANTATLQPKPAAVQALAPEQTKKSHRTKN